MKNKSKSGKFAGLGVVSAIAASLCCITPVLALISGASGIASAFSWLDPARPYLMDITVLVLGFAWYLKLRPVKADEIQCECEEDGLTNGKIGLSNFWQSKKFLAIVTVFAALMLTFPYYSSVFYPKNKNVAVAINPANIETLQLNIKGMTCQACNDEVSHAAEIVPGVMAAKANYKTGIAVVKFDKSEASKEKIIKSIDATGYKVSGEKMAQSPVPGIAGEACGPGGCK